MVNENKAFEIAKKEFSSEIAEGGWPTLYLYPDHWIANCTFPNQGRRSRSIRINADGSFNRI